ncbi:hypothetical protein SAMN02745165_01175 [Malonomonas rubra DSM 5091]|uniref:Motility protein n=1 Tax=Malonomonas rubra DSM 5091 TaxID=1122189 RepID=A0A1M6F721_MALRU|nr:hypothetical protein [Malonomonas rubra]SHI93456.1 hypothetical protein SAMN02745165_01175 [Malonomonas rubra DSM 5091]
MEVTGTSIASQEMQTNKLQAGYDALTKTMQKADQNAANEQQRMEVAQQTGKGLNIDVKA